MGASPRVGRGLRLGERDAHERLMVDHPEDEGQEPAAGQAPPAAASPKWNPLAPSPDPDAPKAEGLGEGERVAKALARAGVASRREVERYIEAGRVALNGQVLTTPAVKVAPGDILTVDGAVVGGPEPTRLFRYHKPSGLITTNSDPQGRPTVFEHLPDGLPRVLAVGRLDLNTEGLLLLTNDGALSRALELPSSGWMRRYRARAYGRIDQNKLDGLAQGVTVDGVAYGPIEARLDKATGHDRELGAANVWISIGITEGKNREVRKVLEHLGLKVNRLIRLAYGPFALGTLELGQVEEVGPRVIREQLAEHVAPENLPTGDRAAAPVLSAASRPRPDAPSPRRAAPPPAKTASPRAGRGAPERRQPAEGAERRLAEAPRKDGRSGWTSGKPGPPGAKAGPASRSGARPRSGGPASGASDGPGRPRPARGWVDKPEARGAKRDARPATRGPDRPTAQRGSADPSHRDRPRDDGQRGERAAAPRPSGKPAGVGPARTTGAPGKPRAGGAGGGKAGGGKPAFGKPSFGKPSPGKPGRAPSVGKAAPAAPSRTGLELTPPMRRTPRGSGPRRPPRKD